jgi:hypothetical protein
VWTFAFALTACAGCAGTGSGHSAGGGADALPAATLRHSPASTTGSTIYVSIAAIPSSIEGFPSSSSGNVAPTVTIAGSNTMLDNLYAYGMTHDAAGNLYVVANDKVTGESNVLEFARGAAGNVKPIRSFQTALVPGSQKPISGTTIAVDGDGYVYVGGVNPGIWNAVFVYPPGATGSQQPLRVMFSLYGGAPIYLALDAHNDLYVMGSSTSNPEVAEYGPAASGNALLRESPAFNERNSGLPAGIAVSPSSGDVFVSAVFGFTNKGAVYSGNASMTKLVATIAGAATGLPFYDRNVIAFDSDGTLYALLSDGLTSPKIEAFAPNAAGDVAPLRTISGPLTNLPPGLDDAPGVTVVPAP